MALKHLEEVATTAGLTADQVKALVALPEDAKDFKVDDHVAPIRTAVETSVKNDPKFYETLDVANMPPAFVKKLETEQYGRAATEVRNNMMKATGLKETDFADLGDEFKKIPVFSAAFAKKLSEGKVTDKELQQKLIEATAEIEKLTGNLPQVEQKYKTQYEAQRADDLFLMGVNTTLAALPGLKVAPHYVSDKLAANVKAKYAFEIVNGMPELRQKDKPTLKVLVNNKELTLKEVLTEMATADNLIDEKKKKVEVSTGTKTDVEGDQKGGFKMSGHVNDKIAKRIASEKTEG